ncbi:MAG TPA: hypothetical protein VF147_02570 [Vicinamibacterales bacterium]
MRRPFVSVVFAMALAVPAANLYAQDPAAAQQPAAPAPPKLTFSSPAGILLVQIKPDQTAVFEEMITKLKAGLAKTEDATLKQQAAGFKVYKSAEPFGANALYIVMVEPVVASSEYELFTLVSKVMTPEELRAPETAEMWKRYQGAFAAGLSKLSLTPIGG